jgi:hypothetical protein
MENIVIVALAMFLGVVLWIHGALSAVGKAQRSLSSFLSAPWRQ